MIICSIVRRYHHRHHCGACSGELESTISMRFRIDSTTFCILRIRLTIACRNVLAVSSFFCIFNFDFTKIVAFKRDNVRLCVKVCCCIAKLLVPNSRYILYFAVRTHAHLCYRLLPISPRRPFYGKLTGIWWHSGASDIFCQAGLLLIADRLVRSLTSVQLYTLTKDYVPKYLCANFNRQVDVI